MAKESKIVARQAEPNRPQTPSPDHGLDRLLKGLLTAQGFRLDPNDWS